MYLKLLAVLGFFWLFVCSFVVNLVVHEIDGKGHKHV